MFKKLLCVTTFLMGLLFCNAQMMPQFTPLPLNPKVKHGVLPNGLTYYILHNEEPKNRANFYIAQKVGSTLEEKDQLGLAHFLEHMAFNGTSHFPGKSMLNYLQGKGIRFGSDINAYTSFDETVYNINNVPTTDKALMDSVLLVLHDWSGEILLEDSEIEAERGVIQEEWRSRNDANFRLMLEMRPKIFQEYQYQQTPIGTMDVVMNFHPDALRAYYKKWYRPDLQGIIIVGDFDADEMEKKVIDLFSTIEMPKNAAKREYVQVSDNKNPIYVGFSDPELPSSQVIITFKSDVLPYEMRNTVEAFMMTTVLERILGDLINNRLSERALSPDCKFSEAMVNFNEYYQAKTKDAFYIFIVPKNDTKEAVADAMEVIARACKTGFTDTELIRVDNEIQSWIENRYNERDKTSNAALARQLCSAFIDNKPAPGIDVEYELWQQLLPVMQVDMINQMAATLLTPDNMVVVSCEPEADGVKVVPENEMISTIQDAMNGQYEAYVDELITEPLIANLPKPGSIQNIEQNDLFGATIYTLSNGIKVVVKSTDFSADEILMTAYRDGGRRIYKPDQAANVIALNMGFESSKIGPFDTKTLQKYLAGKKVSLTVDADIYYDLMSGYSTVKDLPTLMELVYAVFTDLNPDPETWKVNSERLMTQLVNAEKNPQAKFSRELTKTIYGDNPLAKNISAESLAAANYEEIVNMIHAILKNAAEYTFVFTGNVDNATLRPLLEQYVATLPVGMRKKFHVETPIQIVSGNIDNVFKQEMQTPTTMVFNLYQGDMEVNVENSIKISLMGDILGNIYIDTLREEEGGTYSPQAGADLDYNEGKWQLTYLFSTNADQQESLRNRAHEEFMNLLQKGADEANFNKVKEAAIKQYEIQSRKNGYWNSGLVTYFQGHNLMTGYEEALRNLTLSDLNNFMKDLYNNQSRIQVVMEGVPVQ